MHTQHFALVGGSQADRQAVAEQLWLDHGFIRLNIAKEVERAALADRDAWFIDHLDKLEALRLFDTDPVVVEDVEFDEEAHVLRDMGFVVVHCGPSLVAQDAGDLTASVTYRSEAEVVELH